ISESLKQQILLNIVKLRYADVPVFMDVGQVISGYELEGTVTAGGNLFNKTAPGSLGDFLSLGAGGRYLDRPTVTDILDWRCLLCSLACLRSLERGFAT